MMVAVAALRPSASVAPSFPPQQSPIFGHRASSQTVCRFKPRRSFLILAKEAPLGMLVLRYDGSVGLNARWPVKAMSSQAVIAPLTSLHCPTQRGRGPCPR